jgi:hypothetical protein
MWPVYSLSRLISPLSRIAGGGFGAACTPPSPLHNSSAHGLWRHLFICCRSPPLLRSNFSTAAPTRSQGGWFERGDQMNNFLLHSSLIWVLGAEQSAPKDWRKFLEYRRPQIFGQSADILTSCASTSNVKPMFFQDRKLSFWCFCSKKERIYLFLKQNSGTKQNVFYQY